MVDEHHLTRLRLWRRPLGQRLVGTLFLRPNYEWFPRVEIVIEGIENVPRDHTVIFALNHTDRYNYWPFQYKMWRSSDLPMTTSWVKAKYYANPWLGWFFDVCNNIPLPSLGYLILEDARLLLGRRLADHEYRLLRDLVDGRADPQAVLAEAGPDLRRVLCVARRDFRPDLEDYGQFMRRWNDRVMGLVERRSLEALGPKGNNLIVFPQGTRSLRLLPGKPGLAEFAVRHQVTIVPVGSMGSEHLYPGSRPWARRGRAVYRVGRPLSFRDALRDCVVTEPYAPFTQGADKHKAVFDRVTERVTNAINALLDPEYQLDPYAAEGDARDRAARLT